MSTKGLIQLAMDQASRMQRAREMGFDTDQVYYHGTNLDRDIILDKGFNTSDRSLSSDQIPHPRGDNIGAFFSQSKEDAKDFGRNLFETHLSLKNPKVFKTQQEWLDFNRANSGVTPDIRDSDGYIIEEGVFQHKAREVLEGQGYDGVVIEKPNYVRGRGKPWAVAFEPNQIRSVNAAFDPAKKNSSDLLGSADPRLLAATALGTGTAVAAPKAQGLLETIGSGALELLTGAAQGVAESVDDFATYGNPRGGIGRAISPQQAQKIQSAVNNVPGLLDTRALQHLQDQEHLQDRNMAGLLRNIGSVVGGLLSPI